MDTPLSMLAMALFVVAVASGVGAGAVQPDRRKTPAKGNPSLWEPETREWFNSLDRRQLDHIHEWGRLNAPPEGWNGSRMDYVYFEMPRPLWWLWSNVKRALGVSR